GKITVEGGGSFLQFTEGVVSDSGTCTIKVIVTRTQRGDHTLTVADFVSNAGESDPASATLSTPETPILGFSKRFVPDLVPLGGRSTLIYTIENQGEEDAFHLSFNDLFPEGIAIATPPSISTTCEGISITAINGTQAIEVNPDDPLPLPAGETCTLTLDVVGILPGVHNSISSNLTAVGVIGGQPDSAGRAVAQLEVIDPSSILDVSFSKEFIDNPVAPGGTGTLEFSITNNSATDTLTNIRFTDDLEATLPGLIAAEIPTRGGILVEATFGADDGGGGGGGGDPIITGAWDYLDRIENENGTNLGYPIDESGNAWNSVAFDVATSTIGPWESEDAPLQTGGIDGFPGAPDLLFGIDAAPNGENLITTYLFRNTFEITAEQLGEAGWLIDYLIDDGAVIYINGTEIFRTPSMPAGAVETTTLSGLGDETATSTGNLNLSGILVEGTNSIAVEVHQTALTSSDVGFQLQLAPASQNSIVEFAYSDDTFNGTADPEFAEGSLDPTGGFGGGGLTVLVGGQSGFFNQTPASSGGWSRFFNLDDPATVTISLRYRLLFNGSHENDEFGQALLELDGTLFGNGPDNSLAQFTGDGNDGPDHDTGTHPGKLRLTFD
ncbi:MAG: hypothetical protein QGG01_12500, partial [Roseibacillus sp.]|nr:hypothetical protein [Roseibacillus sp.]